MQLKYKSQEIKDANWPIPLWFNFMSLKEMLVCKDCLTLISEKNPLLWDCFRNTLQKKSNPEYKYKFELKNIF